MKTLKNSILAIAVLAASATAMNAQVPGARIPPRTDDHFQRKLVVNRIDIDEKINRPMVAITDGGMYTDNRYPETRGLVQALVNGLKSGKYLAYDPDNLTESMTYEDALAKAKSKIEQPIEEWEDEEEWIDEEAPSYLDEESVEDNLGNSAGNGYNSVNGWDDDQIEVSPYSTAIEFIENRIFQ